MTRPAVSASPRAGWRLDRTVGLTLLLAFGVQTLGAAAWAGAAAERIAVLERRLDRHADVAERLARLEAQGEAARVALARIEARLDRGGAP